VSAGAARTRPARAARAIAVETISEGPASGLDRPMRSVIRSAAQLAALWKQHARMEEPAPKAPPVDFSREAVVVVALGRKPSAGYTVKVTRIEQLPDETLVHVRQTRPSPDAVTAQMITHPHHMVRIPRPRGAVRFVDDEAATDTGPR